LKERELLEWLEDLSKRGHAVPALNDMYRNHMLATAWLAEAHAALASVFPRGHPLLVAWNGVFERAKTYTLAIAQTPLTEPYANVHFVQAIGVVHGAVALIKGGRLGSVLDGVRAETESEVLDQADVLLAGKYPAAAAVLAGGSLETHLLHLCQRHGLTWTGEGSISKYDQAVAQARNAGTVEAYPATDSRLIGGWGALRNDAAHEPTKFTNRDEDTRLMIQGVRQFIARVP